MRPLPLFLGTALLLAGAGCFVGPEKPVVIPARDLERLGVVAEALLRDDGFQDVRRLDPRGPFGAEPSQGGLRLQADKDDANVVKAGQKGGGLGVLSRLFLGDRSSADRMESATVDLLPVSGGHEVRVSAYSRRRGADGKWSDDGLPYGYETQAFARRLMRAYGDADAKAFPSAPVPPATPAPAQGRIVAPQPVLDAPPAKKASRRSTMLFGPQ